MRYLLLLMLVLTTLSGAFAEPFYKYGISSMMSASNTFIYYEELNSYIADKLGVNSEIIHKENYSDMNKLIENQQVHFASICTGAMLYLKDGTYRVVAVPQINGKSTYRSLIIANRNVMAQSPADLRGRTFAMTDRLSNTGYLYPTYYFTKNFGKPDKFFSKVFFTGTHDKSVYLVNKGVVDAAAVDELVYNNLKSQNPDNVANIDILNISPEFGIPPMVASNRMSAEDIENLRRVLLSMHEDEKGKQILDKLMIDKFVIPTAEAYENVMIMKDYVETSD
jgi:phosphonate transport system substrate-binding protein